MLYGLIIDERFLDYASVTLPWKQYIVTIRKKKGKILKPLTQFFPLTMSNVHFFMRSYFYIYKSTRKYIESSTKISTCICNLHTSITHIKYFFSKQLLWVFLVLCYNNKLNSLFTSIRTTCNWNLFYAAQLIVLIT